MPSHRPAHVVPRSLRSCYFQIMTSGSARRGPPPAELVGGQVVRWSSELDSWISTLREEAAADCFFSSLNFYLAAGTVT
jgi:hypothetical protein